MIEGLRVAAKHNLATHNIHKPTFADQVRLMRQLLYSNFEMSSATDEPPESHKTKDGSIRKWREDCAKAVFHEQDLSKKVCIYSET